MAARLFLPTRRRGTNASALSGWRLRYRRCFGTPMWQRQRRQRRQQMAHRKRRQSEESRKEDCFPLNEKASNALLLLLLLRRRFVDRRYFCHFRARLLHPRVEIRRRASTRRLHATAAPRQPNAASAWIRRRRFSNPEARLRRWRRWRRQRDERRAPERPEQPERKRPKKRRRRRKKRKED